jgi:hypothetical protein
MNYRCVWFGAKVAGLVGLVVVSARQASAVAGVADTVIVAADLTDTWKWPRELAQWTQAIENAREQIQRADALIQLVGDPQKMKNELMSAGPDLLKPLDDVIGLETRQDALKFSQQAFTLGSAISKTYNDAKAVGPKYQAFGKDIERNRSRYAHLMMQEAMLARYERAASAEQDVIKAEKQVQERALQQIKAAKTQTDIALFNAQIAASKQRQDLAHQKAEQAKGEMEAFKGHLVVEDERKAEADREWAQTVIDHMKEKALDAYRAQTDGNSLVVQP